MGIRSQLSLNTSPDYSYCFCCGQNNPIGLKLKFVWDGKTARTEFTPNEHHQGWEGMVHGGIVISLLDEAMSYAAFFEGMACVTAEVKARLKLPAPVNEPLTVTGWLTKKNRKLLESRSTVALKDGTVVAEGSAVHFVTGPIDIGNRKNVQRPRRPAVLWDMDGVIVDTAPYHFQAWKQTFAKLGVKYTLAQFKESFGRRNEAIIPELLGKPVSAKEIAAIARKKETLFRRLGQGKIKAFPGAVELLQFLSESNIKMALVSSTPPRNIDSALASLEVKGLFQTIISGTDVKKGKPDPECFLLAASRLGVEPENCVVIEDSTAGVSAAKSAGMKCIAITNTRPGNQLKKADLIIDSLTTIDIGDIEKLILPPGKP
jgi:beta-phosphoglucomutase family hydrolase